MQCPIHSEILLFEDEPGVCGYCSRCKKWHKLEDIKKKEEE